MRLNRGIVEAIFLTFLSFGMLSFLLLMARPVVQSQRTN